MGGAQGGADFQEYETPMPCWNFSMHPATTMARFGPEKGRLFPKHVLRGCMSVYVLNR